MKKLRLTGLFVSFALCLSIFAAPAVSALEVLCEGAYLVDTVTGTVLFEKNANQKMFPAGLTKIMTAIVALENSTPDEMVVISPEAIAHGGGSGGSLKLSAGEEMSVLDLLYCVMLVSSNEAAWALAEHIGGDEATFVDMMNAKAAQLGAASTHFVNASGLHDDNHYTTPKDIWPLTADAAKNPRFMEITNSVEHRIDPTDKNGPSLIGVVLGGQKENSQDPIPSFDDMTKLFTYAFDSFAIVQVLKSGEMLGETGVALGKTKDFVSVSAGEDISILMPKGAKAEDVTKELHFDENLSAPIAKGDTVGRVDLVYEGKVRGTSSLYANFDVEKSEFLQFIQSVSAFLKSGYVKVGGIIVALLIVLYVAATILANRRRQMLLNSHRKRKRRKF